MELIRYDKNEGLLTIEIEIQGTPVWTYYYQEDQKHENSNYTGRPTAHTLGMPAELITKTHLWEFRLANTSPTKIDATIKINWYQEIGAARVKTLVNDWEDTREIESDSGVLIGESGLLITQP